MLNILLLTIGKKTHRMIKNNMQQDELLNQIIDKKYQIKILLYLVSGIVLTTSFCYGILKFLELLAVDLSKAF
jgi:sRNA-binding regulator protein Hfq